MWFACLQTLRDKFRSVLKVEDARAIWQQQFDEGCRPNAYGVVPRYLPHHLLTGAVLRVWSRIEAHYAVLNNHAAAYSEGGAKKYTMRIARVTLGGDAAADALADAGTSSSSVSGPALKTLSPAVSPMRLQTSRSPAGSPVGSGRDRRAQVQGKGSLAATVPAGADEAKAAGAKEAALSLVGIWIPQPRIKEVLAMLEEQRAKDAGEAGGK